MKILEWLFNLLLVLAGAFALFMLGWCIRGYKEQKKGGK
jgi:hypothetical protein